MNVLVIGLGSMGKRRIRLLKKISHKFKIVGIDTNEERRKFCEKEYNIKSYDKIDEVIKENNFESAFVCTSPLSHYNIINKLLENNIHVFSELNLVNDGYHANIELAKRKKLTLFMSSTALYRKEMQYIDNFVKNAKKTFCYNYHVGQYLPDWHPWEKYSDFFVGNNKTNGCRELLAIELPWLISTFGKIKSFNVIKDRITSLNIDYEDIYLLQLIHENGHKGSLIVDVVSLEAVRKLEVFSENTYIEWQGKPDTLKIKNIHTQELERINLYTEIDCLAGYSSTIIENHYLEEIQVFYEEINQRGKAKYTFEDDLYTLEIIDKIEGITSL